MINPLLNLHETTAHLLRCGFTQIEAFKFQRGFIQIEIKDATVTDHEALSKLYLKPTFWVRIFGEDGAFLGRFDFKSDSLLSFFYQ